MPPGSWVKPHVGLTSPACVVSVVAETAAATDDERSRATPLKLRRLHVRTARRRRGTWHPGPAKTFETGESFHDWLESYAQTRSATYVFAPVASNALTLSGFWARVAREGVRWEGGEQPADDPQAPAPAAVPYIARTIVLRGRPDIVRYGRAGRSLVWLSGRQYFDLPDTQLAAAVGYSRSGGTSSDRLPDVSTWGPAERAGLWLQAITRLADWWRSVDGGRWADTVGGLALNFFRRRLSPRTILKHRDVSAGQLETAALWGGRASVWYVGNIHVQKAAGEAGIPVDVPRSGNVEAGPVTLVDVRSMYPFLLASKPFPVRLVGVIDRPKPAALPDLLKTHGVIASVELDARHPEYPARTGDRVVFPTGRVSTVLAGPELERAHRGGEVRQVFRLAYYEMGRPFEPMARALIEMRDAYRREGNPGWELFVKLLSNSFAGKLAQRRTRWERRPNVSPEMEWGEWSTCNHHGKTLSLYRALAGLVWEKLDCPAERRAMGQCFAYLTSYGRCYMRLVREHCPPQSVVSQDTDGLWLLPAGLSAVRAAGLLAADAPGLLRVVKSAAVGRWWSPKHYVADGLWTLAGLTAGAEWSDGTTFTDRNTSNPIHQTVHAPPDQIVEYTRQVTLTTVPVDGTVDPLGWVHPLVWLPPGGHERPAVGG